jgi:isoleucyl-tRNA synthetase
MPYSTYCGTPLSNFEAGLNYKDVNDPACVVSFPIIGQPEVSLIAWTTTPWTLPSNLSLCVNPKLEYIKIVDKTRNNAQFILLEKRLGQIFPEVNKKDCTDEKRAALYTILEKIPGDKLIGLRYEPPLLLVETVLFIAYQGSTLLLLYHTFTCITTILNNAL